MSNLLKRYSCAQATVNINLFGPDQMIVSIEAPEKLTGKMIICEYDKMLIEFPKVKKFLTEKVCSLRCSVNKQKLFPCSKN